MAGHESTLAGVLSAKLLSLLLITGAWSFCTFVVRTLSQRLTFIDLALMGDPESELADSVECLRLAATVKVMSDGMDLALSDTTATEPEDLMRTSKCCGSMFAVVVVLLLLMMMAGVVLW
jgi:hypothetical protein